MSADPYCPGAHPDGWLCVLTKDHDGPHLSVDNRSRWRGTVGRPVRWRSQVEDLPDLPEGESAVNDHSAKAPSYGDALVAAIQERTGGALPVSAQGSPPDTPTKAPREVPQQLALPTPAGQALGYTGIPCDACQSLNTVRSGKCLTCMDCHAAGECG